MAVPDLQILLTFALIGVAILAFATERLQIEVTCVAIVVAVLVCFHAFPVLGSDGSNLLGPTRVLAGFASPALASIMALIIVGHAIFQTNALDPVMAPLLRLGARWPALSLGAGLITAALVSAFMNNTPVVVMFIPIMITVGAKLSVAPSRALMPLSAITILGGMTTLVGSSTNLLVAGVAFDAGLPSVGSGLESLRPTTR